MRKFGKELPQHIFFQQQDAASVKLWNLCNPL